MTRDEFIDKWGQYVRATAPAPKEIARIREFIDDVDVMLATAEELAVGHPSDH